MSQTSTLTRIRHWRGMLRYRPGQESRIRWPSNEEKCNINRPQDQSTAVGPIEGIYVRRSLLPSPQCQNQTATALDNRRLRRVRVWKHAHQYGHAELVMKDSLGSLHVAQENTERLLSRCRLLLFPKNITNTTTFTSPANSIQNALLT